MSLRARIFGAFLIVVLVPASVMWLGARREIEERLRAQYDARVASLASVIEEDLDRRAEEIDRRLSGLSAMLAADNRFRASATGLEDRAYLLDLAPEAMALTGLSMLQIHDETGRILSSGHFRNAFDVVAPALPRGLSGVPDGTALAPVRTAEEEFLALVHLDSVRVGEGLYHLVGGRRVGETFLAGLTRDPELSVRLAHPGGTLGRESGAVARSISIPYLPEEGRPGQARFEISFDASVLQDIRTSTNRWLALVLAGATGVSLLLAGWLSGRVIRPLRELASRARRVSLDQLDVSFPTDRGDEIGELSRVLKGMTRRLQAGARELQDAERRATLGELARQVNHDVRNGLVPIRNVLRHLDDVAENAPDQLPSVFEQRRESLASSVAYLETLAGNYRRLSSRAGAGSADAEAVAASVVESASAGSDIPVEMEETEETAAGAVPSAPVPPTTVRGDPVTIRRIVENLVTNAKDAARDGGRGRGRVTVRTEAPPSSGVVRIVVEDTGRGMSEEQRERAFEDFYTTKEEGTGLGLPVVRRLVRDLGGSVALESREGHGTRVTVELPAGTRSREPENETGTEP